MEIYKGQPLWIYIVFHMYSRVNIWLKAFQITLLLRIYILQAGVNSLTGMKNTNSELFELCHTLFSLIVKAFLLPLTIYSLGFLLQINKCQDIHAVHINTLKALYVNLTFGVLIILPRVKNFFFSSLDCQFIISSKSPKLNK